MLFIHDDKLQCAGGKEEPGGGVRGWGGGGKLVAKENAYTYRRGEKNTRRRGQQREGRREGGREGESK